MNTLRKDRLQFPAITIRQQLLFAVLILCMGGLTGGPMARGEELPPEPGEALLVNEDVNIITGLYTREYSLAGDGHVDYKTARQVVLSEYNDYWNSVVETKEFPLFYWYDGDHDGQFAMWIDQHVEGRPYDIVPYAWKSDGEQSDSTTHFMED